MAQAAVPGNPAQTYDLTVGVMLDVEDMIHMISPTDVPLQGGSGADGSSAITTGTCFEKKVEWLDEELLLPRTIAGATATSTATVLTTATGQRNRFSTGDVLQIGNANNEKALVTGYGTTTDTLLVTREFASTTGATITTAVTVLRVIGQALVEGSDPESARFQDRSNRSNYTQIFGPTAVQVTGSENVVRKYGLNSTTEFEKQAANRIKEQYIQIEQALMYGKQLEDTTNLYRTMDGLTAFISTNVYTTATALTEALVLTGHQAAYEAGGNPDRLLLSPQQKRNFSAVATGPPAVVVQTARVDDGRGTVISYYDSDFGRLTLIMSRWCGTQDAFAFNRDQFELTTLRPMQFEMLAKTGDSMKGQIVAEKTAKFRRQQHAFRFSALTAS